MDIKKESPKSAEQSKLCIKCINFWGTKAREGLCSKCYGQKHKSKETESNNKIKQENQQVPKQEQVVTLTKGPQQNKHKCFSCSKKTGLLGIQCKCGYVFCNMHRLPENHECSINYEEKGKEKLKKDNVKIAHQKLAGI